MGVESQERQHLTAVWRNGGLSASYDSFVGEQTVVLRINFCAKNPPLRQAAKRYTQALLFVSKESFGSKFLLKSATLFFIFSK